MIWNVLGLSASPFVWFCIALFLVVSVIDWMRWRRWRAAHEAEVQLLRMQRDRYHAEVMAQEARSRGVGGTGEHVNTIVTDLGVPRPDDVAERSGWRWR